MKPTITTKNERGIENSITSSFTGEIKKHVDLLMLIKLATSIFFIYTGIFKITNIDAFRLNVTKTGVFSEDLVHFMPYILALTEIGIAVLIIFSRNIGNILFGSIMFLFSVYITYLHNNNLYEVCGCGGVLNGLSYKYHMVINVFFILLSFSSFYIQSFSKEGKRDK